MNDTAPSQCPMHDNIDRRKSAKLAEANVQPDEGARWVKTAEIARKVLRSKKSLQAGAGAEYMTADNPEHISVFFLDGEDHANKKRKTQRFLSPKAVSDQHFKVMTDFTNVLLEEFQKKGSDNLEDISFKLAVEVVGEILGLTDSDRAGRAHRIRRVMEETIVKPKQGIAGLIQKCTQISLIGTFYWRDVRPAINARKKSPKNDALSYYIEEKYPVKSIIIECLTYGAAGMMTTREFIVMAAWYLFEDEALRDRFMQGDTKDQLAILMEILRLEPVAGMIHRRLHEELPDFEGETLPSGELYGIDLRKSNVDEALVGECPFALDPDRAKRVKDLGRYMSFGDGSHSCPGWQVALHETRIFLELLFKVPGIKLAREPDISWHQEVVGYELRNAVVTCDKKD
ncbi:cytochrome P450 [Ketobacter sp. MCCC 1A13808]|uniref:cytochrome P450 n=1 Tax=Ketobacter sp. MCCC 1A13808 TaxID=2602738 RepID=UPI000F150411|nr:cytochrome P450 [Ketobacter sp. MCCC 1A13808]MVF13487.1 cytochrome P450 [Ketobacter sp. MCCC 1A13808]RLP52408.1 MAG: cytochrome P450 [Ketobacter sp.]